MLGLALKGRTRKPIIERTEKTTYSFQKALGGSDRHFLIKSLPSATSLGGKMYKVDRIGGHRENVDTL
jgi:hypothetical protein